MIGPDVALQIAKEHLTKLGWPITSYMFEVRELGDVLRQPMIYVLEDANRVLTGSWLVYYYDAVPTFIKSSNLVVVSKYDGRVHYAGSAYDEG